MVNSIFCYYINHCHQSIVSIIFKISYRLILLPFLINLICCSIERIKCSSKPPRRLNQPFLEGDSGSGQHFLWAIVIIATILLIFLSICFCRCYYRYNEICDEKHSQFDYPFDYAGSSACQTPTPSTSPITIPQSIQLALPSVSQSQIKIYAQAKDQFQDKNTDQPQQLTSIVLHGQSSIKIHANPVKSDSKLRRQSSLRSSL